MAGGQAETLQTVGGAMVVGGLLSFNFLMVAAGVGVYKSPELSGAAKPTMPPGIAPPGA